MFNLILERVVRANNVSKGISLGQLTTGHLANTDNIALIGNDEEMIKFLAKKKLINAEKINCLLVNDDKTE